MLELAREHALERDPVRRPISSFQAIRHRLAETLVAVETADALIDAAWLDGSPGTAAMAKAMAGRRGPHCGPPLPAGPGRDRLHHRARTSPLHPPDPGARRAVRYRAALTSALGSEAIARAELPVMIPL